MLQCLTGLCSRRQKKRKKKEKHQKVSLAFVFRVREHVVLRQAEAVCMYAGCRHVGEFIFFNCLWSLPGFEVTLSEGGKKAKQKSPQVHIATRTPTNCNLHNLFFKLLKCKETRRSLGAQQTRPPAWQLQLNTLPLHICSQLQPEERQHESL